MSDPTPAQKAARIVAVQGLLSSIDSQAATLVTTIITNRKSLTDLAVQRQALVDEVSAIIQAMLAAEWRDTLSDSGDTTSP